MTDEVQDTPKSARSEGARNGWKTRQKNKQDAPAKVGGITKEDAAELRSLIAAVYTAKMAHHAALDALNAKLDSLTAGK